MPAKKTTKTPKKAAEKKPLGIAQKCSEGNTKTSEPIIPTQKLRNWCFTSYEEQCPEFHENMRYLICGKEICPTTGRQHWQCYTYLKNQQTWNAVKKILGDKHFEACKGSPEANIKYCSKDKNFQEFGEKPSQGKRNDINELVQRIEQDGVTSEQILMENPLMYHMYGRTLEKAEDIVSRKKYRTEMTIGYWYWGPTGCGKSHTAFEGYTPETHYVLPLNDHGWWDGYRHQDTVIINDFRGEIKYNELLQMVDKWVYPVARRGREPLQFTSKKVIITSSLPPDKIYNKRNDEDSLEQLYRRFIVTEIRPVASEEEKAKIQSHLDMYERWAT